MSVSSNFKKVEVVATNYPDVIYSDQMRKYIFILNCSCPLLWKKRKECLIFNYIKQSVSETDLIYFDLDVFMTHNTYTLFENIFKSYEFDVSYIHRGFESKWGIINTGIILLRNTKHTQTWLNIMYDTVMRKNNDPQILIDKLLNTSARKTFASFYINQTQILLLPSKPFNMLSKWKDCTDYGVHHYHGPYKSNILKCNLQKTLIS